MTGSAHVPAACASASEFVSQSLLSLLQRGVFPGHHHWHGSHHEHVHGGAVGRNRHGTYTPHLSAPPPTFLPHFSISFLSPHLLNCFLEKFQRGFLEGCFGSAQGMKLFCSFPLPPPRYTVYTVYLVLHERNQSTVESVSRTSSEDLNDWFQTADLTSG